MRVAAVVVSVAGATRNYFRGSHAAIQLLAASVLKLDGRVADAKAILEQVIQLGQDAGAL
jgi:hypothetical protein